MLDAKTLPQPKERDVTITVSDDDVRKVATWMVGWGYRFSEASVLALTEVMSGRSVMLFGECGTGKSLFFKALSEYAEGYERCSCLPVHPYKFAVIRVGAASIRSAKELEDFLLTHEKWQLVVDDVGTENTSMEYGCRYEVVDMILQYRDYSDAATHFITNCGEAELSSRYGDRVIDRLHYCEPIVFQGGTSRCSHGKIPISSSDWHRVFGIWRPKNYEG